MAAESIRVPALTLDGMVSQYARRQISSIALTPDIAAQIDLNDKSNTTGLIIAITTIFLTFILTFGSLRLGVRYFMTRRFFLDDALIVVAIFFTLGFGATILLGLHHGLGQHIWNLNPSTIYYSLGRLIQLMFVANIASACAVTFTKLSIIASYLRIFPYHWLRVVMYTTAGVTIALWIVSIFATIFTCIPVAAAWDFSIKSAKCYPVAHYFYANSAINIATDLVLCAAPLPYFWRLQLPKRQKLIVTSLFFIGGFACVASIVRLAYINLLDNTIDYSWRIYPTVLCTLAECTIGICCVSVPSIRPLLGKFSRFLPASLRTQPKTSARSRETDRQESHAMGYIRRPQPEGGDEDIFYELELGQRETAHKSWHSGTESTSRTDSVAKTVTRPRNSDPVEVSEGAWHGGKTYTCTISAVQRLDSSATDERMWDRDEGIEGRALTKSETFENARYPGA